MRYQNWGLGIKGEKTGLWVKWSHYKNFQLFLQYFSRMAYGVSNNGYFLSALSSPPSCTGYDQNIVY
jgi:hypothetical protein